MLHLGSWKIWAWIAAIVAALAVGATARKVSADSASKTAPDPAAIERTRDTVKMLDDIYKGFVLHITATYVKAQEKTPAARVTKNVFKHVADKGWHTGRLLDVTGAPLNPSNVANSDFEKRAVAKLKSGAAYFDEVGTKDGKPTLRAATPVPIVMNQCIACHPGYKEGDLIGALVYEVPIR
jgi:hypothetical protein